MRLVRVQLSDSGCSSSRGDVGILEVAALHVIRDVESNRARVAHDIVWLFLEAEGIEERRQQPIVSGERWALLLTVSSGE